MAYNPAALLTNAINERLTMNAPIILKPAPDYYIGEETIYRVVESDREDLAPGTLILEGYVRVDNTFIPRDASRWFPIGQWEESKKHIEELAAWQALS